MKKILWLCPLMLLMMAFIGCDDKEKDDDEGLGGQLSETTWAAEESLKTKYCAKLTAAGFVDEDGYGIYKKTTTEYKLAAIISYGGGTLALSLSAEPIQ